MIEIGEVRTLKIEEFSIAFDAMKHGKPEFAYGADSFRLGPVLGQGGTKSVYNARISGEQVALALPNTVDNSVRAAQKWQEELHEPPVTDAIRKLGLKVNDRCAVTQISVDGITFPAITFTRYADLAIEVRDHKNISSSAVKADIFAETPTLDSFIDDSRNLAHETAELIKNDVILGGDSINLGIDEKGLHLFLNDLAHATFAKLSEEDTEIYAARLSMWAVNAIYGGLSHEEYNKHREFFEGDAFDFRHGQAYKQFTSIVLAEAGISS